MKFSRLVTVFIFILFAVQCQGQSSNESFTYGAVILKHTTNEPIAFATVYKSRDLKGTVSNLAGEFWLDNVLPDDTIICSYIGYEKLIIKAQNQRIDTLYFQKKDQLIDEVTILADHSILYELMGAARQMKKAETEISKTYFELESFHHDTRLELFQGYYNGKYQGYDLLSLDMKLGRFTLSPINKRLFASTETSKALYMHSSLSKNPYFPMSPLELNEKKLRKAYTLQLDAKYKNEDKNTIYVIGFTPTNDPERCFEGKIWIDSLNKEILKLQLLIKDTKIHPFNPIWSVHELRNVDLELNKTFEVIDGKIRLQSINFRYDLDYVSEDDSLFRVSTSALLYAYDYQKSFTLPYFHFSNVSNADYRTIQMLPYNEMFWTCNDEFKVQIDEAEKRKFIENTSNINANQLFSTDTIFKRNFFENPYVSWSQNRIRFREDSPDTLHTYPGKSITPSERYHLEVQLFMDINVLCDTVQIITKTIFDPYSSYYKFPSTKESQAFINIYFDLMEMERRKLEAEVNAHPFDSNQIDLDYQKAKAAAITISEVYFKEVQRGTNKEELLKWNARVMEQLNIDNIMLFQVE